MDEFYDGVATEDIVCLRYKHHLARLKDLLNEIIQYRYSNY
jgi:hypothetical protein